MSEKLKRKNRIEWIDIAKGIGIIFIILGHVEFPYYSPFNSEVSFHKIFIYSFHVPLFFFLSGLCFSSKLPPFKEFIIKKIRTLLLPYITFSTIWIAYDIIMAKINDGLTLEYLLHDVKQYVVQTRFLAIWFLTCLFVLEVVFWFIAKITRQNKIAILVLTVLILFGGNIYRWKIDKNLYWNIDIVPTVLPFFTVGYLLKGPISKIKLNRQKALLLFVPILLLNQITNYLNIKYFGNGRIDIYHNSYCNYFLFYLSAFLGIVATILISVYISKTKNKNILLYIGKNSLVFFTLHQIVFRLTVKFIKYYQFTDLYISMIWVGAFLLSFIIMYLVNELFIKTPLKKLIGK